MSTLRFVLCGVLVLALCGTSILLFEIGHPGWSQVLLAAAVLASVALLRTGTSPRTESPPWVSRVVDYARNAPLTTALTTVCLAMAAALALSAFRAGASAALPSDAPLFQAWALVPSAVNDGEWWRLLTSAFMHGSPVHLVMNLMALVVLGAIVEHRLGHGWFAALYGLALLGASLAIWQFASTDLPTIGASGAIYGIFAAHIVLTLTRDRSRRTVLTIAFDVALSVGLLFVPKISAAGHAGGFLVGLAVVLIYVLVERSSSSTSRVARRDA